MKSDRQTLKLLDRDESELLASRLLTDEAPSKVLLDALSETDLELAETDLSLNDHVDTDALDMLFRDPADNVRVSAVLWDYPVVVTPDTVLVFDSPADGDERR